MVRDAFKYLKITGTKYTSTFTRVFLLFILELKRVLKIRT